MGRAFSIKRDYEFECKRTDLFPGIEWSRWTGTAVAFRFCRRSFGFEMTFVVFRSPETSSVMPLSG